MLKQVVSGLNESSAAGCSLLGYKEIKDLYHHGHGDTLKEVMEVLLNGELSGDARALLSSAKLVALLRERTPGHFIRTFRDLPFRGPLIQSLYVLS